MPGAMSPAGTLMVEDALNKMIYRDGSRSLQTEKRRGLVPRGSHSCFGDFPPDFMPKKPLTRSRSATGVRDKEKMTVGPGMTVTGFSSASPGSRPGSRPTTPTASARLAASRKLSRPSSAVSLSGYHDGPPKAGAARRRPIKTSMFRVYYERGDLPINIDHCSLGKLHWKVDIEKLDYHHYLPIFFDGLREKEDPYRFMAVTGAYDLLQRGGDKILPVVPQLIIPIKEALNTRDPQIMCTTMKLIQELVLSGEMIGEALVPYYRQLLPTFSIFRQKNIPTKDMGDSIDYGQRKRLNLGDLISETLTILEENGGEDAFINIKYMIPTYESAVLTGV
eukprot:TRINITY_DN47655_c0_g1_i1.p1 TRINITY_DN47655_c0_g1~~TRINITY_DN47655_c0_g1_i1.p1  ORF type:complete len:364 (+),score=52.49 TRINITY_DN47655_c0_g1_i1:88-1092(+)